MILRRTSRLFRRTEAQRIFPPLQSTSTPLRATPELPLAYIGTASRTKLRDDLDDHARRFRLGGEKEGVGTFAADAV
jgi:hypothetical protein